MEVDIAPHDVQIQPAERTSVARPPVLATSGALSTADLQVDTLDAAIQLDPQKIRRGLDRATAAVGLADCIDEVLLPVLRQLAHWCGAGRCEANQLRMATEAARAWIDGRSAFMPAPRQPDPIQLARAAGLAHR